MARQSIIQREYKRIKTVAIYATKRRELKVQVRDLKKTPEERFAAQLALQSLPRNSSKTRLVSRCVITGRPRGVYSKFGLSRNKLREFTMNGEVAGLRKSSW